MDLGDFEQDVWGTWLCSMWLQECLNVRVSDTRFENMNSQKCDLGDWINMWKSLLSYHLALNTGGHWILKLHSLTWFLCMCVYLVTTVFSWGYGPFIFFSLKFLQVHKAKKSMHSLTACAHREHWLLSECMWHQISERSILKRTFALPFYVRTHLS